MMSSPSSCLSLSNCDGATFAGPWWTKLPSRDPSPVLAGHDALWYETTGPDKDNDEWMIVTGGVLVENDENSDDNGDDWSDDVFHVWALNLTNTEEEEWIRMSTPSSKTEAATLNTTASSLLFGNATSNYTKEDECAFSQEENDFHDDKHEDDEWNRNDLWQWAKNCPPTSRFGHVSAIVNDYLYIFGGIGGGGEGMHAPVMSAIYDGYVPPTISDDAYSYDPHVYRISMRDIFQDEASGWQRIIPRNPLSKELLLNPMVGGLWYDGDNDDDDHDDDYNIMDMEQTSTGADSDDDYTTNTITLEEEEYNEVPKLVAYATKEKILQYDFAEDRWDHEFLSDVSSYCDFPERNYAAVVSGHFLFLVGKHGSDRSTTMIDLKAKQVTEPYSQRYESFPYHHLKPGSSLVAYVDSKSSHHVLIGYGGIHHSEAAELAVVEAWMYKDSNEGDDLWETETEEDRDTFHYDYAKGDALTILRTHAYYRSEQPKDRKLHSAILSPRTGLMYVFGGISEGWSSGEEAKSKSKKVGFSNSTLTEPVWRIDVGSESSCVLPIESGIYGNGDDFTSYFDDDGIYRNGSYGIRDKPVTGPASLMPILFPTFFFLLLLLRARHDRLLVESTATVNGHHHHPSGSRGGLWNVRGSGPPPRGMSLDQLDTVAPQRVLTIDDDEVKTDEMVCTICLLSYGAGEVVRDLPCKHTFHRQCVDHWLQGEAHCPLCRISLQDVLAEQQQQQREQALAADAAAAAAASVAQNRQAVEQDNSDIGNTSAFRLLRILSIFPRGAGNDQHSEQESNQETSELELPENGVYSLDLTEEDNDRHCHDYDDDISVASTSSNYSLSSLANSIVSVASSAAGSTVERGEQMLSEQRRRRRRRRRRLHGSQRRRGDSAVAAAEPLAPTDVEGNPMSAMV